MSADSILNVRQVRWWISLIFLACLWNIGFLWQWASWMWGRDHYQFFPWVIAGTMWLVSQRLPEIQWLTRPVFSVRVALYFLTSLLLFLLAVRTGSHWLGLLSFLTTLWASVWYVGGASAASELRGPLMVLLLIVPLPLNLDLQFIIGLQKMATWFASGMLDLRLLKHTVSGVAIRTADKSYMVEEACSGIHSLFSAVSVMVFVSVYCRYGIPRLVLSLVQTMLWVFAANAFRVFLIVYADSRYQIPLDTGWRHEALGILAYGVSLAFAFSTDQLLRFVFPMSKKALKASREEIHAVFLKPWKKAMSAILDEPALRGQAALIVPLVLVICVFAPAACYSAVRHFRVSPSHNVASVTDAGVLTSLPEDRLSGIAGGWTQSGFRKESREPDDPFGMSSTIWEFQGLGLKAVISVDGYYSEWHDLAYCYTGSGWKLAAGDNGFTEIGGRRVPWTRLKLYRNTGDHALVYFACFDSKQNPVQPPEASGSFLRTLKNRLTAGGITGEVAAPVEPPVFQVQMFVPSAQELLVNEVQVLERLFRDAQSQILSQPGAGQ